MVWFGTFRKGNKKVEAGIPRHTMTHDGSMGRLYIYLHEAHKNQPNLSVHTIHGLLLVMLNQKLKNGI